MKLTRSQKDALQWLQRHNGDGVFAKDGVLVAAGERAPFMRTTWNTLRDLGAVEFYLNNRRVRVVNATS